jgi:hypothetical protein
LWTWTVFQISYVHFKIFSTNITSVVLFQDWKKSNGLPMETHM